MSRIGRKSITVPAGVDVKIEGNTVCAKGPKGELSTTFNPMISVKLDNGVITVERPDDSNMSKSLHGTTRTIINNLITGVHEGYSQKLLLVGVGYKAALQGQDLNLSLGYSHPVIFKAENGITFEVPDSTTVVVHGASKQAVGAIAANIRAKRPPEPYLGKGVKYDGEKIRRKAGKASK